MIYAALFRGLNVGGNSIVKMARLREVFEELGYPDAATYVQSGNVVFSASESPASLSRSLESKISDALGIPIRILLRTKGELGKVLLRNPFLREKGIGEKELHVSFMAERPAPALLRKLAAIPAGRDRFRASGREIYLHCPDGYGRTKLSNNVIERVLGLRATTRNWNTVGELHRMTLLTNPR